MAKAKITAGFEHDYLDNAVVRIKKNRGKLTLNEIEDVLRHSGNGMFQGHYIIVINASEASCGGSDYWEMEEPVGDVVDLYVVSQEDKCPVCNKYVPPFEWCPHCGEPWKGKV